MEKITLSLRERTRIAKKFVTWAKSKRIDVMPSTFLGWLEMQGYLNVANIKAELETEDAELESE